MTGPRLTPMQRAVARYIRAECSIVPVGIVAAMIGRSRQQLHNVVTSAGIIPGGGADAQDARLKSAFERDMGKPLSVTEWRRMRSLIEQEAADRLTSTIPNPEPDAELDRMMVKLSKEISQ